MFEEERGKITTAPVAEELWNSFAMWIFGICGAEARCRFKVVENKLLSFFEETNYVWHRFLLINIWSSRLFINESMKFEFIQTSFNQFIWFM